MDLPPPPPAFDPREPAPITSSGSPAHPVNFGSSSSSRSGARSPPLVVGDRSTFRRASATAGGPGSRSVSSPPSPRQQAHSPSSRRSPPPMSSSGNTPSRSFGSSSSAAAASASHYGASSASHIHHAQPSPSDSDPRIFERDVEEPLNAGPTASASSGDHHAHPHAHAHDSSDGKVPTVLDDAVEALASVSMSAGSSGLYGIEVEAPVPSRVLQHQQPQRATSPQPPSFGSLSPKPSGVFVSSIAPTRDLSRSPSPTQATSAAVNTTNTSASSPSSRRPDFGTRLSSAISIAPALPGAFPADSTTPWIEATSGSKSGQAASMSDVGGEGDVFAAPPGGSSTASTRSWRKKIDDWVGPKPAALLSEEEARAEAAKRSPPPPLTASTSAPPPVLVTPTERRRISFVAYNDLLHQHPVAVSPLSDITRGVVEPDHLPGTVSPGGNINVAGGSASAIGTVRARSPFGKRGSVPNMSGSDAEGGEWEREGLGQGLQQRLEMLAASDTK